MAPLAGHADRAEQQDEEAREVAGEQPARVALERAREPDRVLCADLGRGTVAAAEQYTAPTTIEVVRPERTIVRDVDEVLPVVLSSAALLVALGGCAFLLAGSIRGRRPGSSH